ncbi:AAA family ATPase [Solicola sp. PLA-1-18]|uniref:AAA family ATPase n=1 Tax=Solicola sp. PLA-1-18 TaxID=3380532 RepID=UPI003B8040D9
MRILRVRLTHYRGIDDLEVELDPVGVTVVQGPNEAGKSSIPEALRLVRDYPDSSRATPVKAVKPVGLDVGPEVEVELETGPYRLVLSKRFLKSPRTELRVLRPRPEQLAGREAHDRFDAILTATLDRQLWDALQLVQGEALDQPALARVEPLRTALGALAGDDDAAEGHADLLGAVESELQRFYTPRAQRPTGELEAAVVAEREARERVDVLTAELDAVDVQVTRHASRQRELAGIEQAEEQLEVERASLRTRAAEVDRLTLDVESAQAGLDKARLVLADAERVDEERSRLAAEVDERENALATAVRSTTRLQALVDEHHDPVAATSRAALEADTVRRDTEVAHRRALGVVDLVRCEHDLAALLERRAAVDSAQDDTDAARRALHSRPFDEGAVEAIAEATTELRLAEQGRDLAVARVRVEVLGERAVTVDGDGVRDAADVPVTADTVVEVPGTVRVTVSPGGGARDLGALVEQRRRELDLLLVEHAVDDLDAAREQRDAHRLRVSALDDAERRLVDALAGDTRDDLVAACASTEARADDLRERFGGTALPALAEAQAEADRLADALDVARSAAESAAAEADSAQAAAQKRAHETVRLRQQHDSAVAEQVRAQRALDRHRGVCSDDDVAARLASAHDEVADHEDRLAESAAALEQHDPGTLEVLQRNADARVARLADDRREVEDALTGLRALLDEVADRGLQDALDAAAAELQHADDALARTRARAEAALLLHTTLLAHRRRSQERYVRPFTEAIERLGAVVFGPGFGVEVTPDLAISARTLGGTTVPFESLSGGAREQLSVLGRLACAGLVSDDGGAPVVLDDALGFADPSRLDAVCAVVNDVGRRAQVLVLTCHPDRFRAIGSARVVRI